MLNYESNQNPTQEELYEDIQFEYFLSHTKKLFPTVLSQNKEFEILIKLMAWSLANSYTQPRILKYIYNPDLVISSILPKLADTLNFKYPIDYPQDQLRILIKYLQKIRRARGTFDSVKQLIRLLESSEDDILNLSFAEYSSVEIEEITPGFLYIRYNKIKDWYFTNEMLKLVMPAGYKWKLENSLNTEDQTVVIRNREDMGYAHERFRAGTDTRMLAEYSSIESVSVQKLNQPI